MSHIYRTVLRPWTHPRNMKTHKSNIPKMKLFICLLTILALISSAKARGGKFVRHTQEDIAYIACIGYVQDYATFSSSDLDDLSVYCKNSAALGTISQCYIDLGNSSSKIGYFLDQCNKLGSHLTKDEFYSQYENGTEYYISDTDEGYNSSTIIDSPLKLNTTTSEFYFNSYRGKLMNYNLTYIFASILVGYWGVVVLFASIVNWTLYFFPRLLNFGVFRYWRKHIALPALIKSHKSDSRFLKIFHFMVPSRLDSLIIIIWIILLILAMLKYEVVYPNVLFSDKNAMMSKLVASRAGIISLFCLPLQILFAGRNNVVQFFTHWNYSRMMTIHRWLSRIAVVFIFIHTVAICNNRVIFGLFKSSNRDLYVQWGYISLAAGVIMLIQASLWCRRKSYEAFYLIHLCMALLFIIGAYKHVDIFGNGYYIYFYTCFGVWSFDRLIRFIRLISFGAPKLLVEVRAQEVLRVTIPKPKHWKSRPGQHAFVHFLRWTSFWQSHPFTFVDTPEENETHIMFYIKIKGGITNEIYKFVNQHEDQKAELRVSVEGPYGSKLPVSRFDKVVLVSGGNGVPGLYSEALHLLQREPIEQVIKFYWIIRNWGSLEWFQEELEKFIGTKVKPIVYVTRPGDFDTASSFSVNWSSSSSSSEDFSDWEKKSDHAHTKCKVVDPVLSMERAFPYIEFRTGRPKIEELVAQEIEESPGSIAFVSCAHPNMVDDVRRLVWKNLTTKKLVEFYDQLQVW